MIARLMRDKGVYDFGQAARLVKARMPAVRFQILGRIEPNNPTAVSPAECRRWTEEGSVDILPDTRDVRPFLARSTLLAHPSFYRTGLPRTIRSEERCVGQAWVRTCSTRLQLTH